MTTPIGGRPLTHQDMRCEPFMSGEVLRTDGFCWFCDSRFRGRWALKYPDSSAGSGWGYCECRHLFESGVLPPPRPSGPIPRST
jgi:hypothetical protein